MSKCGIIAKDIDTGKMKMKMYRDDDGEFKGEARCGYVKVCDGFLNNMNVREGSSNMLNTKNRKYLKQKNS